MFCAIDIVFTEFLCNTLQRRCDVPLGTCKPYDHFAGNCDINCAKRAAALMYFASPGDCCLIVQEPVVRENVILCEESYFCGEESFDQVESRHLQSEMMIVKSLACIRMFELGVITLLCGNAYI